MADERMTGDGGRVPGAVDVPDRPGVIAPPPLIFAAAIAVALAIHHWAAPVGFGLPPVVRHGLGAVLIAAALVLAAAAIRLFGRAGTHVEPWKPATALVTTGIYGHTRNPMYVAMALLQTGLAFLLDSAPVLLALVPALAVIRYGVIAREERYLDRKFPEAYPAYRRRVRRWL